MSQFDDCTGLGDVIDLRSAASFFDNSIAVPELLTGNSKPAKGYAYRLAREEKAGKRDVSVNSGNSTKVKSCDEGSPWL